MTPAPRLSECPQELCSGSLRDTCPPLPCSATHSPQDTTPTPNARHCGKDKENEACALDGMLLGLKGGGALPLATAQRACGAPGYRRARSQTRKHKHCVFSLPRGNCRERAKLRNSANGARQALLGEGGGEGRRWSESRVSVTQCEPGLKADRPADRAVACV